MKHGERAANRLPSRVVAALAVGPIVGLAVFYLWPFATLLVRAINGSAVADTLRRGATWDVAWFTLWQAVVSTAITMLVGLAPAYIVARFEFPGRQLCERCENSERQDLERDYAIGGR